MKLQLIGHDYRYAAEQIMTVLFPGDKPVFADCERGEDNCATLELSVGRVWVIAETRMNRDGKRAVGRARALLAELEVDALARDSVCQKLLKQSFFKAAVAITGEMPPWGALTGIRPARLVTRMLERGMTEGEAVAAMCGEYFVTPERAKLCLATARASMQAKAELKDNDLSVYVGIPFCPTRCAYCSFVSASVEKTFAMVDPYLDRLCEEIEMMGRSVRELGLSVKSLYIGGGTPTTLSAPRLARLTDALAQSFDLSHLAEYTVEAGRPDTVTAEKLSVLRDHGVTRVSINPQTMDDHVLQAIGRAHTAEDVYRAMELAKDSGIVHINMDLIAGLPEDTPEGFLRSLDACLTLQPDNLTVHTLAVKKGSRLKLEELAVPDAAAVRQMLDYAHETLTAAGFSPYYLYRQKYMSGSFENVGWSRPGAEGLYNIYIMEELHTILGLGAGASTKLTDPRTGNIERYFNCKYAKEYIEDPEKLQADRDKFEAFERELLKGEAEHGK
jgi:oxygen-independent coproporphyrinogen-3 oxidase